MIANYGCPDPAPPALACGSVIHGIQFDFDSAAIRTESAAVLGALRSGLAGVASGSIRIEDHRWLNRAKGEAQIVVARLGLRVDTARHREAHH